MTIAIALPALGLLSPGGIALGWIPGQGIMAVTALRLHGRPFGDKNLVLQGFLCVSADHSFIHSLAPFCCDLPFLGFVRDAGVMR